MVYKTNYIFFLLLFKLDEGPDVAINEAIFVMFEGVPLTVVGCYIVFALGQDKGYTDKYSPLPEGTPIGKGLYLTIKGEQQQNKAA